MAPELGPALVRDFIFSYSLRMRWRKKFCWGNVPSNMRKGICHTLILSSKNFMIDQDLLRSLWSCVCLWQAKDTLCSDGNSLQLNLHLSLSERNQEKGWTGEKKKKKRWFHHWLLMPGPLWSRRWPCLFQLHFSGHLQKVHELPKCLSA